MQCPDEELASKWKTGDNSAFEIIFHRYERRVLNMAARMTGNLDDAEDVAQETFIRANKSIDGFRGGKFSTWIFRIAVNLCLDRARRKVNQTSSLDSLIEQADWQEPESNTGDPQYTLMKEEFRRAVRSVLTSIPPHYRILLVLRHMDEMPYEEIAKVIGCSVNALGVRLHRAREVFRKRINPFIEENGGSMQDEMQRLKITDISAL